MSEADNPLSKWFSEDELTDIFRGFSDETTENSQEWSVEASESSNGNRYVLRSGLARLDFDAYKEFGMLRWDAVIPDFLHPGGTVEYFQTAEEFLLYRLVERVGIPIRETMVMTKNRYREGSKATFTFRDGEERRYSLGKQNEYFEFMLDFCRNQKPIEALYMEGNTTHGQPAYHLRVNYPVSGYQAGSMGLAIPNMLYRKDTWSPYLMGWVLDTHVQKDYFADKKKAAKDVSELVTTCVNTRAEPL